MCVCVDSLFCSASFSASTEVRVRCSFLPQPLRASETKRFYKNLVFSTSRIALVHVHKTRRVLRQDWLQCLFVLDLVSLISRPRARVSCFPPTVVVHGPRPGHVPRAHGHSFESPHHEPQRGSRAGTGSDKITYVARACFVSLGPSIAFHTVRTSGRVRGGLNQNGQRTRIV